MRLSRRVFALAALLAVLMCPPAYSQAVSIGALLESPERYDGRVVTVSGVIAVYRERASRAGNAYTTFRLQEGGASVAVFVWGHRGLRDGVRVRVTGVFQRVRRVGPFTFYNEIEAQRIDVLGTRGLLPGDRAALVSVGEAAFQPRLPAVGTGAWRLYVSRPLRVGVKRHELWETRASGYPCAACRAEAEGGATGCGPSGGSWKSSRVTGG